MSDYKSKAELIRENAHLQEFRDTYKQQVEDAEMDMRKFLGQVADALGVRENYQYEATHYRWGYAHTMTEYDWARLRRDIEYLAEKNFNDARVKALGKAIQKAAEK